MLTTRNLPIIVRVGGKVINRWFYPYVLADSLIKQKLSSNTYTTFTKLEL